MASKNINDSLLLLRTRIDLVDEKLINLLNQRSQLAIEIGKIKRHNNMTILCPQREQQVINKICSINKGPLTNKHITIIWQQIMQINCILEKEKIKSVVYLGPAGTFSEQAVVNYFGKIHKRISVNSIDEVFKKIENGKVDYAIVPVENSTDGIISRTLDLMLETNCLIIGEISIPIEHCLLTNVNTTNLKLIKRVYGHPQSLAQCQKWLNQNLPEVQLISVSSNTKGAEQVILESNSAAIAGKYVLQHYPLHCLVNMIHDNPNNRTRFYALGYSITESTGKDHTSIIIALCDEVGALYYILQSFIKYKISICHFTSRPAWNKNWNYYFHVDIVGHINNPNVSAALEELKNKVVFFKLLGSYSINSINFIK